MTSLDNEADFYVDAYSAYKVASTLFRTKNVCTKRNKTYYILELIVTMVNSI